MTVSGHQTTSTKLSLIVASLDEGEELHETLRSVFAGSVLPDEVIVVDDGSIDGSCDALERDEWRSRSVRVHRIERHGIAAARNIGSRIANGAHLAFLDAHCRLDPRCLSELQIALDARPDAIVAPSICDYGSNVYGCGVRLIDADLRVRWLPPTGTNGASHHLPIAPGGCLALSRVTFDHLGGFGKFRELGQEDVEFGLRAWRAGVDVLAVTSARLAHRFRSIPPYSFKSTSRAFNVARIALVHFDGRRREECLRKVIGTPRAAEVLVDAFTSDWEAQRNAIASVSKRKIEEFFDNFGDWQ
ncbi:MAG: glycosyltransferase family 2 protein [Methylocella sp.]